MGSKDKKNRKKCYLYTRVSTGIQVEGYSLEAQLSELEREAEYRDLEVVRHFSDEGKSGKNIKGREEFREMLRCIQDGSDGIEYVLVFKLSRFGRNAADVLNSVQFMQDYGVNLICVKDAIDSSNATGKLMISVLSAVAEIERENIHEQTMAGRYQKARDGRWNGGFAPYGYKLVYSSEVTADGRRRAGHLEIEESEAEVIRAIYEKFAEGNIGLGGVAKWLNKKGYEKKVRQNGTVSRFSAAFVKGVLDNPIYMGKIAYGRRKTERIEGSRNESHVVKQKDYNTYYDGLHEAIVSEDLWYKAHEKRKETGIKYDKIYSLQHEHILSSILKCPVCGSGMYGNVSRKKKKTTGPNGEPEWYKDQYTYVCKHRKLIDGHTCSYSRQPNQEKINAEVEAIIKEFINKEVADEGEAKVDYLANDVATRLSNEASGDIDIKKSDLERLQKQYDKACIAKDKLIERIDSLDVLDVNYDVKYDDYEKRLDRFYTEIRELEKKITELQDTINLMTMESDTYREILEKYKRVMSEGIHFYSDYEKKWFFSQCIERIDIFKDDKEHGRWVKGIRFKIPVVYGNEEDPYQYYSDYSRDSVKHDETICLISKNETDKKQISYREEEVVDCACIYG